MPGQFALNNYRVRIRERENSIFHCPARTDVLAHIMPYYEAGTWKLMRSILRPGDVFVDVGAHVGIYSVPVARKVGPNGFVISIEPCPVNEVLTKNIKINGLDQCVIVKKAAWSRIADLDFDWCARTTASSSCIGGWQNSHGKAQNQVMKLRVQGTPLDDIIESIDRPIKEVKLLKIDVEGSEVEVLRGATETLGITKYIIFETTEQNYGACLSLLQDHFGVSPIEPACDLKTFNSLASRQH